MKPFQLSKDSSFKISVPTTKIDIEEDTVQVKQHYEPKMIYRPIKIIHPPPVAKAIIKSCNCKKSQCLKQYCDCFANGQTCSENCNCVGCFNTNQNQKIRKQAKQLIKNRDPAAFKASFKVLPKQIPMQFPLSVRWLSKLRFNNQKMLILIFLCTLQKLKADIYQASDSKYYEVVRKIKRPSDLLFFTEGLTFIDDDTLLESTGLYGDSEIHYITSALTEANSALNSRHQLDKKYFGEGCTKIHGKNGDSKVYMLTYKERKAFVFNDDLSQIEAEFDIPQEIQEGWGMTHFFQKGKPMLVVSDGTNRLFHVDPKDFTIKKTVEVRKADGGQLNNLNELEIYKDGSVLANIYQTSYIAKISVEDGQLQELWNFQALLDDTESIKGKGYTDPMFNKVFNGIAYREDKLILGGKQWPYFYQVRMMNPEDVPQ